MKEKSKKNILTKSGDPILMKWKGEENRAMDYYYQNDFVAFSKIFKYLMWKDSMILDCWNSLNRRGKNLKRSDGIKIIETFHGKGISL